MPPIVVAYSGGVDATAALAWLKGEYGADIVTVTMDLGQGLEFEAIRDRALAVGARRAHVLDVREEFARSYVLPALKAQALSEDRCPVTTALGRPLIVRKLVDIAEIERATLVAHGADQSDDQMKFEVTTRTLNPGLTVVAPARNWGTARPQVVPYASRPDVVVPGAPASPYRTTANLLGRSIECGSLEDRWGDVPAQIYTLTKPPAECPAEPAYIEIAFDRGVPVAVNGVAMPPLDLIASLTTLAGAHGVGRSSTAEYGPLGVNSRRAYEAPAAVLLYLAHRELQTLVTSPDLNRFGHLVGLQYADLIDSGLWFTPLREALDAFVERVQERVSGAVRLQLFRGVCRCVSRRSSHVLPDTEQAASERGRSFDPVAAPGVLESRERPADLTGQKVSNRPKRSLVTT
jgi:argininosuccinate synthase